MGVGADNYFQIKLNNEILAESPSGSDEVTSVNYRVWHIFPVQLRKGTNLFNIICSGDGGTIDSIGITIYDNTAEEIGAATDDSQL